MSNVRVLCVDDSALMRSFLRITLSTDPSIEVVGTASNAFTAREMIKDLYPTVLTLDINMPLMNGLVFLEKLMRLRPMPVVMFSAMTEHGSDLALQALTLGAVDAIAKPNPGSPAAWSAVGLELIEKVKNASMAHAMIAEPCEAVMTARRHPHPTGRIVAIGASTGGVQVIRSVLQELPADCPPIMIAQHMPAMFTRSFAERLNASCRMDVREARDGLPMRNGLVVIGPGDRHLELERSGHDMICRLRPRFTRPGIAPSADHLLESVADAAGSSGVGIILTGMGKDGAQGLARMRKAGAITASQSEATCLIYGMPRAAAECGAAKYEIDIRDLAAFILDAPSGARLHRYTEECGISVPR